MDGAEDPDARLLGAARALAVDAVTADVVEEFRAAGVRSILLKGPTVAALLYPEESRPYVDSDILVPPADVARAQEVLMRLGFEQGPVEIEPQLGLPHARTWSRAGDGAMVDLHESIAGVGAAPGELWEALQSVTEPTAVARVECAGLQPHAVALVVALHAAQHGGEVERPLEDLRRAIARVPDTEWERASRLAGVLAATVNFVSGVRLVEGGPELAERIGLPSPELVDAASGPHSPTRLALGFARLAEEPSLRGKLAIARQEVAPSAEHMRWWSPLARRGPLGLAAAYGWRFLQLLWRTPPSLLAWRRSTRR